MMLQTLLPGQSQRYAFAGSAIGALLPLIGLSTEALSQGAAFDFPAWVNEPAHALMFTVPVLAGLAFHRFGTISDTLLAKLKARERSERNLLKLSLQDRLTGLPNRRALEREIDRIVQARTQGRFRPALLLLDLDKFKHVNDTMGHEAGDELLRLFAERLRGALGPLVRLFRLGGDEFVILLSGAPGDTDVERLCAMIEARADEPFDLRAGKALTGVSIGVSYLETNDASMADILRRADLALYVAKDIAGSSHAIYSEDVARVMLDQMQMEQDIAKGLANREFFLEFQPISNAADGNLQGCEALVRWRHPQRGVLSPEAFLAVAERSGHILALGRFVISEAIRNAALWPVHVGISVNVSGNEFRNPAFVAHVAQTLRDHGVEPRRLTIEITESTFAIDIGIVRAGLDELKRMGVRIAIDDFGIGFSSIHHLRNFPVDEIKVDRSFTRVMAEGGRETEIVDIIVKLGRLFHLTATIEGVETRSQLDMAVKLGASAIQGFHISHPVSADAVRKLIFSAGFKPQQPDLMISA
jgi:diguanylate cyclase (GGDEF)-like protein